MAKTLEEHLYRSARTKEEYLDPVTLRRRLQRIAQGLDIHRTGSQDDLQGSSNNQNSGMEQNRQMMSGGQNAGWNQLQGGMNQQQLNQGSMQGNHMLSQMQQSLGMQSQGQMSQLQQQIPQMQANNWSQMSGALQDPGMMSRSSIGMDGSQENGSATMSQSGSGWLGDTGSLQGDQGNPIISEYPNTAKFQDPDASQKKKVILQQQQRLLLLRHASKCKAGPACTTKFCNQMVVLWKHMKTCRDRNCKTSHCLSSRCVLNHYRICKSQGRTANCEVCGPVMSKIKARDDGSVDPLVRDDPLAASQQSLPSMQSQPQGSQMATVAAQMMAHQRAQADAMQGLPPHPQLQSESAQGMAMGIPSGRPQGDAASVSSASSSQRNQGVGMDNNTIGLLQGAISGNLNGLNALGVPGGLNASGLPLGALPTTNVNHSGLPGSGTNMDSGEISAAGVTGINLSSGDMDTSAEVGVRTATTSAGDGNNTHTSDVAMPMGTMGESTGQSDHSQLHQLKQHQLKMRAQLESLKELQRQQQQLLDQQTRLREQSLLVSDPNSPQAQQLQQQQLLLDELQRRCQQQQTRLQKEIELQSNAVNMVDGSVSAATAEQQQLSQQMSQHLQEFASQVAAASSAFGTSGPQFPHALPQVGSEQGSDEPLDAFGDQVTAESGPTMDSFRTKARETNANLTQQNRGGKGKRVKGKALRQHIEELQAETGVKDVKSEYKRRLSMDPADREWSHKRAKSDDAAPSVPIVLPDNSCSLISFMERDSVTKHLESLNKRVRLSSRTVTHKCLPVIQELIDDQFGWVFHDAVDPVALGLPDYFEVVKKPMHLELVKKKLENAIYPEMDMFARDVRLVFENAILYNGESSEVGELAQAMLLKFDKLYSDLVQGTLLASLFFVLMDSKSKAHSCTGVESSQLQLENRGEACSLCAQQKRRFEPAVLYCHGTMQRIKRGATYYTDDSKSNYWSESFVASLKDDQELVLDDETKILKSDLEECKNDALPEEEWITCNVCGSRVHQICALFNSTTAKEKPSFACPNCVLASNDESKDSSSQSSGFKRAADLPHCQLSENIEKGVLVALEKAYKGRAKDAGVDVRDIEKVEKLSIRVMSSVDKKIATGEEMIKRYGDKGFPESFSVTSKCIALFQEIHGIDTLLFAVYVDEYGSACPAPNRKRVYISCLDSVKYLEPKAYRTLVYQQILVEYLKSAKARGFHSAHVWSCPPTPGDDYIFNCHPQHQLIPREDMLRSWFHAMLDKAKAAGIVTHTNNLYDEYFVSDQTSLSSLPYFEGDYIPGHVENIIRQISANPEADADSDSDEVVRRLGENLSKMKDNFIVAHLVTGLGSEMSEEEAESFDNDAEEERVAPAESKEKGTKASDSQEKEDIEAKNEDEEEAEEPDTEENESVENVEDAEEGGETLPATKGKESTKTTDAASAAKGDSVDDSAAEMDSEEITKTEGHAKDGQAIDTALKLSDPEETIVSGAQRTASETSKEAQDKVKITKDVKNEMFGSRQQFLSYCQAHHYQFDELRRAKHSTMMVLFQGPNASEPKSTIQNSHRVQREQQLLDDRRRQSQNELYQTAKNDEI